MRSIRSAPLPATLLLLFGPLLAPSGCASKPPPQPARPEWENLMADHRWIGTLRSAQPKPSPDASRKEMIEIVLENHRKIEPVWVPFMDRLKDYADRTGDSRAARLWAEEMAMLGDEYLDVLARADRALAIYRDALNEDPSSDAIRERIARAERMRFVDETAFSQIRSGMSETEVIALVGRPREDWIRQIERDRRIYSVWIYPRNDGGAAAVYLDAGVVYHSNWDAAQDEKENL